jgi:hypothetical protein
MGITRNNGVPVADSTSNISSPDAVGNKTDAASRTAATVSLIGLLRQVLNEATEVEEHAHSGERWFGAAAAPYGETNLEDRIGAGAAASEAAALQVDAGNDDWGTWTQILGSSDTPVDSGSKLYFDLHRLRLDAAEHNAQRYLVQIALQEDAPADDPGSSDIYTEVEFVSPGAGSLTFVEPVTLQTPRVAAATKVWMRTRAPDQNTSTIDFYIGLHEYTY